MPSKLVVNAQKDSRTVKSAGTENVETIAKELFARFGVPVEASRAFVNAVVGKLDETEAAFVATDAALEKEIGDDDPLRKARDKAAREVSAILVGLRPTVTAAHGEGAPAELGLDGPTPNDAQTLATAGKRVVAALGSWRVRPSLLEDVEFKPAKWKAKLTQPVADLDAALDSLAKEDRQAQSLRADRDRAFLAFDQTHNSTANILSALLDAIGRNGQAGNVRRTRRKDLPETPETPPTA